jgi:quinol monooxygenase YgiN
MAGSIVFISRSRIREGHLDAVRGHVHAAAELIEAGKPGTVLFEAYLDEAAGVLEIVHVFPDADAMDRHMEGAAERAEAAWTDLEPEGFSIHGEPAPATLGMLRSMAQARGIDLRHVPEHAGGYLRRARA